MGAAWSPPRRGRPSSYPSVGEYPGSTAMVPPVSMASVERVRIWSDGAMKLYADLPGRRARQILADCLVVLWVVLWSWFGMAVHDGTMALAAPGRQIAESATGLAGSMSDAGE